MANDYDGESVTIMDLNNESNALPKLYNSEVVIKAIEV
jgi:hypothetical protein